MKDLQWFETWFASPYYHILYKDRDPKEAEFFMTNILNYLKPQQQSKILDMACGTGRHSIFLSSRGMDVTGIDLAKKSILKAKAAEHEHLHFYVHDMRLPFREHYFDYVFNLFTSFGYFENSVDNLAAVRAIANNLKSGGKALIDFLNPCHVLERLVPHEIKSVKGIDFEITRRHQNGLMVKDINFTDQGEAFHYQEKVQMLDRDDFIKYFDQCNLIMKDTFGDYHLGDYDDCSSERLIMIAEKQ